MSILSLIASENFIAVNKTLIKAFGVDEAIILGELASEYEYWKKRGELDESGHFFSTIENIEENTGIKEKKQRTILNSLKEQGLVDIKLKGLPAKRYIRLNDEKLVAELLNNDGEKGVTSSVKMAELERPKEPTNNNNITKINNKNKKKESKNSFNDIIVEYAKTLDYEIRAEVTDLLIEWLKVRKAKRAALTDRAIQINIDKLNSLAAQSGMNIPAYLREVICRGWAAFYPINTYGNSKPPAKIGANGIAISDEKSDLDDLF